jgi:hypothetical protein
MLNNYILLECIPGLYHGMGSRWYHNEHQQIEAFYLFGQLSVQW